ncbi:MAG: DUF2258 domain-containing protein [Thermoproteota archaeon]
MGEAQQVVKISTGVVVAAIFADKLRRTILAALGKNVPKDILIAEVAKLNQELYKKIVEEMKTDKRDPIQITLNAIYDKQLNKLEFRDIAIERFLPESKVTSAIESANRELNALKEEIEKLKSQYESEIQNYRKQIERLKEFINNLAKEISSFLQTI